jgi:hypothetical protein
MSGNQETVGGLFARHALSAVVASVCLLMQPLAAHAQQDPTTVMGLGLGVVTLPASAVNTCGGNSTGYLGVELMAGVALGDWRVGARGQGFGGVVNDCALLSPIRWEGVHTDRFQPFDRVHGGGSALGVFAHYLRPGGHWSAGGGFGRVWPINQPFVEVTGSVRTGGRVALVLRIDQRWVYLPYDVITAEWHDSRIVREISREPGRSWPRAHSVTLGLDFRRR